jgi:hypothetical protein
MYCCCTVDEGMAELIIYKMIENKSRADEKAVIKILRHVSQSGGDYWQIPRAMHFCIVSMKTYALDHLCVEAQFNSKPLH